MLGAAAGVLLVLPRATGAVRTWDGDTDDNWSNPANWDALPAAGDTAVFTDADASTNAAAVTHVADVSTAIAGLDYRNTASNYHGLRIAGGVTLTNTAFLRVAYDQSVSAAVTVLAGDAASGLVFDSADLQIGTEASSSKGPKGYLTLGSPARRLGFSGSLTKLSIGKGYLLGGSCYGLLDLRYAQLQNADGALAIAGDLSIGADGRGVAGLLALSEATGVRRLDVAGNVTLGYGYYNAITGQVGEDPDGDGTYRLPAGTGMSIGTPASPRNLFVGGMTYNGQYGSGHGELLFTEKIAGCTNGTTFAAALLAVRIGYNANAQDKGSATGVVDLRGARCVNAGGVLALDTLQVGRGPNTDGALLFSEATGIARLEVATTLELGIGTTAWNKYGRARVGEDPDGDGVYELPPGTSLKIGRAGSPAGAVILAQNGGNQAMAGRLILNRKQVGGVNRTTFEMYAGTLTIGAEANPSDGMAAGVLDAGEATLAGLDVTTATVGSENSGTGRLVLGPGQGRIGTLNVGVNSAADGEVELNGTRLAVDTALTLGAAASTRVALQGGAAGFDLGAAATVTVDPAAQCTFNFPAPKHVGYYWAVRWSGDHVAALQALVARFQATYAPALRGPPSVFYRAGFTYYGYDLWTPGGMAVIVE